MGTNGHIDIQTELIELFDDDLSTKLPRIDGIEKTSIYHHLRSYSYATR